jgi:hypothetical protein
VKLFFRRLVSPLLRLTRPHTTACQRCGWPWDYAEPHLYPYAPGSSIFFVCEWCWPQTSGVIRLFYAMVVVRGLGKGWRWNQAWPDDKAQKVIDLLGEEPA